MTCLGPVALEGRHAVWRDRDLPRLGATDGVLGQAISKCPRLVTPSLATYHILPWRKPRPALLVDGHVCVFGGGRGRNGAGFCAGLLHVDQELIALLGRGGGHQLESRRRLEECCRCRHRGWSCSVWVPPCPRKSGDGFRFRRRGLSWLGIVGRCVHRVSASLRSSCCYHFGGGVRNSFKKSWTHRQIQAYPLAGNPALPAHPCNRPGAVF